MGNGPESKRDHIRAGRALGVSRDLMGGFSAALCLCIGMELLAATIIYDAPMLNAARRDEHMRARWLIIPNMGISFLVQTATALRAVDYVFGVGKRSPPNEANQDTMKAALHKNGAYFALAIEWRLPQFTRRDSEWLAQERREHCDEEFPHSNLCRPNPGGNEFRCAHSISVGH